MFLEESFSQGDNLNLNLLILWKQNFFMNENIMEGDSGDPLRALKGGNQGHSINDNQIVHVVVTNLDGQEVSNYGIPNGDVGIGGENLVEMNEPNSEALDGVGWASPNCQFLALLAWWVLVRHI